MSPASYGYFVQTTPPHQVIGIHDHAKAVVGNPNQFGLSDVEVRDVDPVQQRIEMLRRVLSIGWIRVRNRGSEASVEHSSDWTHVLEAIAEKADDMNMGEFTYLVFRHIETRQELCLYVRDLRYALAVNELESLIEQVK